MNQLDVYERQLLEGWEAVFKKGQLTMWIMLALKHKPQHMAAIKDFISHATNGALTADDKSMYRALRRYREVEMIDYKEAAGTNGPDLKVYFLTETGQRILAAFVERNITSVFFKPYVKELL